MPIYSHSKLSTFEDCKHKYKLRYIDNIRFESKKAAHLVLGTVVHETLEKLYKDLKFQKLNSLEELKTFFLDRWARSYTSDVINPKESEGITEEHFKKMAWKYVEDYYNTYKPFNQLTILGLETSDKLKLANGSIYDIRIDKLACKDNTYFVCDYKTNLSLKEQSEADEDRQLAMYAHWVKQKFKDAKSVVLLWHMLAFNKEVTSKRSDSELKDLEESVIKLIKEIESTKEFPTNPKKNCIFCEYKSMCPSFSHEAKLEQKTLKEYLKDDGLKLVNEFSELKKKKDEVEEKIEETKEDLINYSKQERIDTIFGSNMKVSVKEVEKYSCKEENKDKLENELKRKGLEKEYSQISYLKLYSNVDELPKSVTKLLEKEKDYRVSLKKK
ncbi:MAG: PD-(D/E)XK nuclease family protein [archaeon]